MTSPEQWREDFRGIVTAIEVLSARVADEHDAVQALWRLRQLQVAVSDLTRQYVAQGRREGHTWAVLGAALGLSRQSAHERYRSVDSAVIDPLDPTL